MRIEKLRSVVLMLSAAAGIASAADKWIPVGPDAPMVGRALLNVGYVALNDNGNRVATLRSVVNGGDFKMDILTEFDCRSQRQRALSSATTDRNGRLVGAVGGNKGWSAREHHLGLAEACGAPLAKP